MSESFEEVGSFPVVVPDEYDSDTVLTEFHREHRPELTYFSQEITDESCGNVSNKLVPGRRFLVRMFAVRLGCRVSSEDCLEVIAAHKGILVGAPGVSLAFKHGKRYMRNTGKSYTSFDEKNALPLHGDCPGIPCMYAGDFGDFCFDLVEFNCVQDDRAVVLCFCNEQVPIP